MKTKFVEIHVSSTAVQWQHQKVVGSIPTGAFLCRVCTFFLSSAWFLSRYSGLLSQSKDMHGMDTLNCP